MRGASELNEKKLSKVKYNPFLLGPLQRAVPTTETQREMWATLVLDPQSTLCYNEVLVLELNGKLDHRAVDMAFQGLLKRHDSLRSSFSPDGKFFLVNEYRYQEVDQLHFHSEELENFKLKSVTTPFDMEKGPCFKATLITLAPLKSVIVFNAHHIICDGWSYSILLTEFSQLYESFKNGDEPTLPVALNFSDYALEEESSGLNQEDRKFWLNQFSRPFSGNNLPLDYPRPSYRSYESARIDLEIPGPIVSEIKKFASQNRCSLYTALMASFQLLLHKLTKSQDLVVGMATAAQSMPGKEHLVGHLVNMLPLRSEINPDSTGIKFLQELRSLMMNALDHQSYSFGSLLKDLNLKRNPAEVPLVNVVFNIDQQNVGQNLEFRDLEVSYTSVPRQFENFEIFINAVSCGPKLVFECQYNVNLFKADTIRSWLQSMSFILQSLMKNPNATIRELAIPGLIIPENAQLKESTLSVIKKRHSASEERVEKIWKRLLKLEAIDPEENFFSLGGHSLLVVEMLPLLKEEFNAEVTARNVFENPTIAELAGFLGNNFSATEKVLREEIPPVPFRGYYPVTHNQMQVWYLEEKHPKTTMHNLPSSIRLRFKVEPMILEKTLKFLMARHEVMRSRIVVKDGLPVQEILPADLVNKSFRLEIVEVSEIRLQDLLEKEANHVFDKTQSPLFTAKLFKLNPEDFVFFFMPHHSIWDGWSFDIFFEELDTIYSALVRNHNPEFRASPEISYAAYAEWLNQKILRDELKHEILFWKSKLEQPLPILELPQDFKRPLIANHDGGTLSFNLSFNEIQSISRFARKQGTSLYNVFLTAFKITLARFSNSDDIVVGTPVRCRNNPKLLQTLGYFVNTVALRSSVNLRESFEVNLKNIGNTALEAMDHSLVPFQVVLNEVSYQRDDSRTPIYQTFFSYQDVSNRKPMVNGHSYTQINVNKASTHTDLDLWIKANENKIEGAFEYRKDLFKEETIKGFLDAFLYLLNNLGTFKSILEKQILPSSQIQRILSTLNTTDTDRKFRSFFQMFEEMVLNHPQKIAIENAHQRMTYEELNGKANQLAHSLRRSGISNGNLVGLSLNRDINIMIGLLGILKAGAGYVPLDPGFPQDRLDYMITSSGIGILLTEEKLSGRFKLGTKQILLENLLQDSSLPKENLNLAIDLNETSYVIYTSGSTGNPKGVQISHKALSNFLCSMKNRPGITGSDKLLAVTTLSFDIAALELFLPLISGSTIYVAGSFDVIDGKALKDIIEKNSITFMQATPSTWRLLLSAGWKGDRNFKVLCGGEPFPKDLAQTLMSMVGSVWNMYGPTETTVWSTCKRLSMSDEFISVGTPIDNTYIYILDENLNLSPIGVPGELYIGGVGLAEGYYNRPDLTNEKFIPNPFVPGEKMYATGDMARLTSDGEVECLGRQDGQVKVRGYRIELGEIEAQLNAVPEILTNAVITKEVRPGDTRIIAFLVSRSHAPVDEKYLREAIGAKLPKYMIPSHFVFLDEIPQTLNGKIDKKTLGSMFKLETSENLPAPVLKNVVEEDTTPLTTEMRALWKNVLNLSDIRSGDNFFSIGGNSLLAVDLSTQISKKYGYSFQLSMLLEFPEFGSFVREFKAKYQSSFQSPIVDGFEYVVPIKTSGTKNPVFCFHTVGGNVLNYIQLVPALGDDRPMYGIQSYGLKTHVYAETIEQMASAYIQEIKKVQPQGPYLLAGGSMGGMLALEVAQQLIRMGNEIEKLIMFDTFGPAFNISKYKNDKLSRWHNFRRSMEYRFRMLKLYLKKRILKILDAPLTLEMKLFELEINNYYALWRYRPQSFPGDLYLIRAKIAEHGWYSDPHLGWSSTIQGEVKTIEINGNHDTFIESPELIEALSKVV